MKTQKRIASALFCLMTAGILTACQPPAAAPVSAPAAAPAEAPRREVIEHRDTVVIPVPVPERGHEHDHDNDRDRRR